MLTSTAALEDPFLDFEIMLMYHTQRVLINENDVLRALAGIIRRLSEKINCRFFQ
jgi:hypothetical protein